jgi:hypothetical protein
MVLRMQEIQAHPTSMLPICKPPSASITMLVALVEVVVAVVVLTVKKAALAARTALVPLTLAM